MCCLEWGDPPGSSTSLPTGLKSLASPVVELKIFLTMAQSAQVVSKVGSTLSVRARTETA
jgi:hypothetical protein